MRLRFLAGKQYAAWALSLLFASSMFIMQAQVLIKRHPDRTDCPDTHLRLTARHPDGSPATLRESDLYLWFSLGSADIRSLENDEPAKPNTPDTDVLIVVRPLAGVDTAMVDAVVRNLHAASGFHWKTAVLAPDGSVTPFMSTSFGNDEGGLRSALTHATASDLTARSSTEWPTAERDAFRQLQKLSGRHVIVELARVVDDSAIPSEEVAYVQDRTLDLAASNDMAQIYRLAAAPAPGGTGGATPAPLPAHPYEATGGQRATTVDALFHDIVADAPGSYDLVIRPLFSCKPGESYSLRITSFVPDTLLFYPSAIRMAKSQ